MTKTKITAEQVRQLGNLAKLSMTDAQVQTLRGEISSILDYFDAVDHVKASVEVEKTGEDASTLRADEVGPSDPEGVLRSVPQRKGRFVKAPRVF